MRRGSLNQKAVNLRVGLFVLLGLTLAVGGVLALGLGRMFQHTIGAETYLDESIQGLAAGSAVNFRGIPIGTVSRIAFLTNEYPLSTEDRRFGVASRLLIVHMELDPGALGGAFKGIEHGLDRLDRMVGDGLRVRLASTGLTGLAYLEVTYLAPADHPTMDVWWQPRSFYIPSAASTLTKLTSTAEGVMKDINNGDIASLLTRAGGLIESGTVLVEDLRGLVGEVRNVTGGPALRTMVDDVAATAANLKTLSQQASAQVPQTLAGLDRSAVAVERLVTELERTATAIDLAPILDHARATAAELRATSAALPTTVALANRTLERLEGTLGRVDGVIGRGQGDISALLDRVAAIAENLRQLSANAKRYPSQLTLGAPPTPAHYNGRGAGDEGRR